MIMEYLLSSAFKFYYVEIVIYQIQECGFYLKFTEDRLMKFFENIKM